MKKGTIFVYCGYVMFLLFCAVSFIGCLGNGYGVPRSVQEDDFVLTITGQNGVTHDQTVGGIYTFTDASGAGLLAPTDFPATLFTGDIYGLTATTPIIVVIGDGITELDGDCFKD